MNKHNPVTVMIFWTMPLEGIFRTVNKPWFCNLNQGTKPGFVTTHLNCGQVGFGSVESKKKPEVITEKTLKALRVLINKMGVVA